ncbi:MAG: glycosyltransferase [Planctomycetota bacterium]
MKMLWVRPRVPWPLTSGASQYSFGLLRALSEEFSITMLAPELEDGPEEAEELSRHLERLVTVVPPNRRSSAHRLLYGIWGRVRACGRGTLPALYMKWGLLAPMRELTAKCGFDLVQFEFWTTAALAREAGASVGGRRVVLLHDVEHVRYARDAALAQEESRRRKLERAAARAREFLRGLWGSVDLILTVTDADRAHVEAELGGRVPVRALPAIVESAPECPEERIDPGNLVFTGVMTHGPNTDGVVYFCREILGRIRTNAPGAVFTIVGRRMVREVQELAGEGVEIVTDAPAVRPYLERGEVFVAPLRTGSGIKMKVLEAMACGKAVVTTSVGAEGLGARSGEEIAIADAPEEFARAVTELLHDAPRRRRMGVAAREFVRRNHSLEAAGGRIRAIYRDLVSCKEHAAREAD